MDSSMSVQEKAEPGQDRVKTSYRGLGVGNATIKLQNYGIVW